MLSSSMYGITVLCTVYGGELCFIFVTTWQMSSFGGCVGSTTVCSRVFYRHNCDICGLRRLWEMTSRKKEKKKEKTNHVFAPDSRQHVLLSGTRSGGEGTLRPSRAVTVHLTFNPRSNIHRKGISFKFKDCELLTKWTWWTPGQLWCYSRDIWSNTIIIIKYSFYTLKDRKL